MSFNIRDCKPARLDPKFPEANRLGVDLAALVVDNAAKCKMLSGEKQARASYTRASVRIGGRPETPQRAQATARPAPSIRNPLGYA
ncbi:hypothetical protein CKAH01_03651 [Colletotrichum kahawae]|uniref:Uncharacterized protein n=1 Tax=Colletotrichum kahawae TaxID=34407 RepID=A0AAD9YNT9_COLKA|nr:hypothetical protein CKAH01_03651 [Colletotrichum kahawae]